MNEEKFNQLCATRRGKLGVCTCKMNEIREAMNSGNVEAVSTGLEELNAALNEFRNVHQSAQVLLDEEERKSYNDWYLPKIQNFETFLKEFATYKIVQKDLQAVIFPSDSISNVSHRKRKSLRSIASSSSRTTSVSSARLRAEAEKAALLQRAEGLKKKHSLELERIEVQNAMERVELETELVSVDAKVRVLQSFDTECMESKLISSEGSESSGDGINKYIKSQQGTNEILQPEHLPVEYAKISVIPKTPMQRALTHNVRLQRSQGPCQIQPLNQIGQTSADATVPLVPSGISSNNLSAITDLIVQQQKMSSLPTRHVPVFKCSGCRISLVPCWLLIYLLMPSPDDSDPSDDMSLDSMRSVSKLCNTRTLASTETNSVSSSTLSIAFEHCIESKTNSSQDRLLP